MTEQELKQLLRTECMRVTFTKKNGDERVMECTLNEDVIPKTSGGSGREPKEGLVTVFDLEADAWRCFYFDSVTNIEVIDAD